MIVRKRLFPRTFMDFGAVLFLLSMIQIIYWFELFHVMPDYLEPSSRWYFVHCIIGTWLLFNIVGNYVIVFLNDTSIRGRILPSDFGPDWRFCAVCEGLVPPRSWHCPVCDVCILKRDHHCNFTACCVGHENQRYFMMFLLHLSLATCYASYFNVIYLWRYTTFSFLGVLQLIFPVALFVFGGDTSFTQLYRLFCVITIIGLIAALSLTFYHLSNLLEGKVMHERVKNITDYDLGLVENIKQVFGSRWYLTWASPFVKSELPFDGINWGIVKKRAPKTK